MRERRDKLTKDRPTPSLVEDGTLEGVGRYDSMLARNRLTSGLQAEVVELQKIMEGWATVNHESANAGSIWDCALVTVGGWTWWTKERPRLVNRESTNAGSHGRPCAGNDVAASCPIDADEQPYSTSVCNEPAV